MPQWLPKSSRARPTSQQLPLIEHQGKRNVDQGWCKHSAEGATSGRAARRGEWSAPPGAVASTISFAASAKKNAIPMSLTRKWTKIWLEVDDVFAKGEGGLTFCRRS